jgi:hypothetical protein
MVVCQLFPLAMRAALGLGMTARRFPPPWTVEKTDACFIVKDRGSLSLAYVYFEDEPGRRAAAKLLTKKIELLAELAAEPRHTLGRRRLYGGSVDRMLPQRFQALIGDFGRIVDCFRWMLAAVTQDNEPFHASINQSGL